MPIEVVPRVRLRNSVPPGILCVPYAAYEVGSGDSPKIQIACPCNVDVQVAGACAPIRDYQISMGVDGGRDLVAIGGFNRGEKSLDGIYVRVVDGVGTGHLCSALGVTRECDQLTITQPGSNASTVNCRPGGAICNGRGLARVGRVLHISHDGL